jgi:hypothetical protein
MSFLLPWMVMHATESKASVLQCRVPEGSVLIQAESTFSTNFLYGVQVNRPEAQDCLGESYLNLNHAGLAEGKTDWKADWVFQVPQKGKYHIWLLDNHALGEVQWQINDEPWVEKKVYCKVEAGFKTPRALNMAGWNRITEDSGLVLDVGRNPQKLSIRIRPGNENRAVYFMDAIAVVPVGQSPKGWVKEVPEPVKESNPSLMIRSLETAPVIDGSFDQTAWKQMAWVNLVDSVSGMPPAKSTKTWVGYRPEGLYLFMECKEPNASDMLTRQTVRDSNVWEDDCIEVFWGTSNAKLGHLIVNSRGVIFDEGFGLGSRWDARATVVTGKTVDSWTVELFWPAKYMNIESLSEGQRYLFNVAREEKKLGELSVWSLTGGNLNNSECFGTLILGKQLPGLFEGEVTGWVKDVQQQPVERARVTWGSLTAISDKNGRFILRGPGQKGQDMMTGWLSGYEGRRQGFTMSDEVTFLLRPKTNYGLTIDLNFPEDAAYRVISVDVDEKIAGDYYPSESAWKAPAKIDTFAALGQAQPFSVVVYAKKNLGKVEVTVSSLKDAAGNTLPAAELRMVRVWPQRKGYEGTVLTDPVPELLDPFAAVVIDQNTFRQFWMTVLPPEKAVPGDYQAVMTIKPEKDKPTIIPIHVKVLPFTLLEPTHKTLGVFYYGRSHNWWRFNEGTTVKNYPAEFLDLKQHGVRALLFCDTPDFVVRQNGRLNVFSGFDRCVQATPGQTQQFSSLKEGEVGIDLEEFSGVVDLIHRYGLDRLLIQYQSLKKPIASVTGVVDAEIGWHGRCQVNDEFANLLTRVVKMINQAVAAKGLSPIYYGVDDEVYWGGEYRMSGFMRLAKIVKDAGGLGAITMGYTQMPEELQEMRTVVDLPIGCGAYDQIQKQNTGNWKNRLGGYGQCWDPDYHAMRKTTGICFWFSPMTSYFSHAYQSSVGDPFNDLDGSCQDMNATYPDPKTGKPIPTVQWEGYRQGFYDLCYLNTLEKKIQTLPEGPEQQTCRKAWQQITKIVQGYADSAGNLDALNSILPSDANRIRQIAADALEKVSLKP